MEITIFITLFVLGLLLMVISGLLKDKLAIRVILVMSSAVIFATLGIAAMNLESSYCSNQNISEQYINANETNYIITCERSFYTSQTMSSLSYGFFILDIVLTIIYVLNIFSKKGEGYA